MYVEILENDTTFTKSINDHWIKIRKRTHTDVTMEGICPEIRTTNQCTVYKADSQNLGSKTLGKSAHASLHLDLNLLFFYYFVFPKYQGSRGGTRGTSNNQDLRFFCTLTVLGRILEGRRFGNHTNDQ